MTKIHNDTGEIPMTHTKSNPFLALLVRQTPLSWRLTALWIGGIAIVGHIVLLIWAASVNDYSHQQAYGETLVYLHSAFLLGSVAFSLLTAVFASILTMLWMRRDETFDLLRMTEIENRSFVTACFWGVLHRLRIPMVLFIITAPLTALMSSIEFYWETRPRPNFYYDDPRPSFGSYVLTYLLFVIFHTALIELNLIGAAAGIWAGLRFRQLTSAIASAVGVTFAMLLLYVATAIGGILLLSSFININIFDGDNIDSLIVINIWALVTWILPLFLIIRGYLKIGERVVRRD